MMLSNFAMLYSVVSPSFAAMASASSISQPTGLPAASLNSLGAYVASVPMTSLPAETISSGSLAAAASSFVTDAAPPEAAAEPAGVAGALFTQPESSRAADARRAIGARRASFMVSFLVLIGRGDVMTQSP